MTPKQAERQPINRQMTYKKVSIVMPHCPVCHEQLSGNGSGVLPYTWCFSAFCLWRDGRHVIVCRDGRDWHDDWWFAGVRTSALGTSDLLPKELIIKNVT